MKRAVLALVVCVLATGVAQVFGPAVLAQAPPQVTKDQVNRWMAELSNWGRWGKADEIGTLNLITADTRRHALRLVLWKKTPDPCQG
jgi:hypothetical protein